MPEHHEKISENKTEVTAANVNRESNAVQLKDNRESSVIQQKLSEKTVNKQSSFVPIQRKNNTGLPDHLKSGIENLSGHAMDDVKVHYNSDKPAQLNAHAYAQGTDIHVASGQEKHLAHEAWHVVQQKQGRVKPTLQMKGKVNVNDDKGLEKEADVMGAKALQLHNIQRKSAGTEVYKETPFSLNTVFQRVAILQRKITNGAVKEKIKQHYATQKVDFKILNILLQDAFDNTDSYDAAIERIDRGIAHDNAMFAPPTEPIEDSEDSSDEELNNSLIDVSVGKKKTKERPKIDAGEDRVRPKFKSSVPEIATSKSKLEEEWKGSNTKAFYAKTRELLQIARDPKHKGNKAAIQKLDELINGYKQHESVKKLIDGAVRVKAVKAKGASSGTGLDELFKTSETMKYLELSYRPPQDMKAVAKFDGQEFDWMDAQEQIRLSTEFIIWAGDLVNEISGHTGTFQKKYQGSWMTQRQSVMHEVRDDAISKRSNPATGIAEAIGTHLRITENVEGFIEEKYKGTKAGDALTSDGHSVDERYDEILKDLAKHRDVLKSYLVDFRKKAVVSGNSSPLIARHGGSDYQPESPMHHSVDEDDIEMQKAGKVNGNPLYNLASQWRKSQAVPNKKIPPKPINPVVTEARNFIKDRWDAKKAASINKSAKLQAKKLGEDADPDEIDKVMITVYIEKLKGEKSDTEIEEMIQKLNTEAASL